MKRALVCVFLVLGCQGKEGKPISESGGGTGSAATSATPTPSLTGGSADFDGALAELEGYRARMCKCPDVMCANAVFKEFTTWRLEFVKGNASRPKPTAEQDKKGNELNRAMMACKAKVSMTAGPGSAGSGAGSAAPANADPIENSLAELDAFKTKMCGCKDKPCADKLQTEFAEWQRNLRLKLIEKPNKMQEVRGNALQKEMQECRKKAETATPGAPGGTAKVDHFLTEMQGYRDKICACTTKDCATKLQAEMAAWIDKAAKEVADVKPTKDQDDKADRLEGEMKACASKLK